MDIQTAKQIKIADYLHSLGFSPVKQQDKPVVQITAKGRNGSLVQGEYRTQPMV